MAYAAVTTDKTITVCVVAMVMVGMLSMEAEGDVCGKPASVNGCSVPLQLPFFYKGVFTPACNRHDICYGCGAVYGLSRADCDQAFLSDMIFACTTTNPRVRRHAPPRKSRLKQYAKLHAARADHGPQSLGFRPRAAPHRNSRHKAELQHPPSMPRAASRSAPQHISRHPSQQQAPALKPHALSPGARQHTSRHHSVLQHPAVMPHAANRIWNVSPQVLSSIVTVTGGAQDSSSSYLLATDENARGLTVEGKREKNYGPGLAESSTKLRDPPKTLSKVSQHKTQNTLDQEDIMPPSQNGEGRLYRKVDHGDPKGHRDTQKHKDTQEHNPRLNTSGRKSRRMKRETWCRTFARNVYYPAVHAFGATHFSTRARAELYCMQPWVPSCLPIAARPR